MLYKTLHNINKYLVSTNKDKCIDNSKYTKLYDYFNIMNIYKVRDNNRPDNNKYYYKEHYFFKHDKSDVMLVHINLDEFTLSLSSDTKFYIKELFGYNVDMTNMFTDIRDIHFKEIGAIRFDIDDCFFLENKYGIPDLQEYQNYCFKKIERQEYLYNLR